MSAKKLKMKAVCVLLLFGLTSVCGVSLFKHHYEAEEDNDIIVPLVSPKNMDLSYLNIDCVSKTRNLKMFEMIGGVEKTKFQDRQFSGRVQCDREALILGQVRIHLTGVTPQDSGLYVCRTDAEYKTEEGQLSFRSAVSFEINVRVKSDTSLATTKPGSDNNVEELRGAPASPKRHMDKAKFIFECIIVGFIVVLSMFFISVTLVRACRASDNKEHKLLPSYTQAV